MDKQEIKIINEIFKQTTWLTLSKEVEIIEDGAGVGHFNVETSKGILAFRVIISPDFPLREIYFLTNSIQGYNHQMHQGSICLIASPAVTIQDRLLLELDKLQIWIDKYYIKEEVDRHYEYLIFANTIPLSFLFEEDITKPSIIRDYGSFTYGCIEENKDTENEYGAYITYDLGNRKSRWSQSFKKTIKHTFAGLWVIINQPPVVQRRQPIEDWGNLLNLFNVSQIREFYQASLNFQRISAFSDGFALAVGYKIPREESFEVHWNIIYVRYDDFPFKVIDNKILLVNDVDKIKWCQTSNASYERIFGRGKLTDELTNKNILIIGTGAIGSSLLKALIRGGCRTITISDGDIIEPGNVCRGEFKFTDSYILKTASLHKDALTISPYVDLNIWKKLEPIKKDNLHYNQLKSKLNTYDFIFDCSTDKYLSVMLDQMTLRSQIINLSISDEAKHMAVVTGFGNIHTTKSNLYDRVSTGNKEPFFVGTGCWHPTFRASYVDIHTLLMLAIEEMDNKLSNRQEIKSFMVKKESPATESISYSIDYNV